MKDKNILLVIEDSEEDFIATERALKGGESGILNAIVHCQDGEEGLDYLFHRNKYTDQEAFPLPNLIILDLNLPMIDGREVLEVIKSHNELKKIPVIILTTSSDSHDIDSCYDLGANSYIQKPVKLDSFVESVGRIKNYWFDIVLLPRSE